jgi:uncharacterized protein YukE
VATWIRAASNPRGLLLSISLECVAAPRAFRVPLEREQRAMPRPQGPEGGERVGERVKFDMGAETLSTLARQTEGAGRELADLVKQVAGVADDLKGNFEGQAKRTFDQFVNDADAVAKDLQSSLDRILQGVTELDEAFGTGETEMAEETKQNRDRAQFDRARFR